MIQCQIRKNIFVKLSNISIKISSLTTEDLHLYSETDSFRILNYMNIYHHWRINYNNPDRYYQHHQQHYQRLRCCCRNDDIGRSRHNAIRCVIQLEKLILRVRFYQGFCAEIATLIKKVYL